MSGGGSTGPGAPSGVLGLSPFWERGGASASGCAVVEPEREAQRLVQTRELLS